PSGARISWLSDWRRTNARKKSGDRASRSVSSCWRAADCASWNAVKGNRLQIKICGLTNLEDAKVCVELVAAMIGLNFYPPSLRYLERQRARKFVDGWC